MARKKKKSIVTPLLTVGLILAVVLGGLLVFLKDSSSPDASMSKDQIEEKLAQIADPRDREIKRITLAVRQYELQNQRLPGSLSELVPVYLTQIPVDPATGNAFDYETQGSEFQIGGNVKTAKAVPAHVANTIPQAKPKAPPPLHNDDLLLASFDLKPDENQFVYDPSGKRDPFTPFDFAPKDDPNDANNTPLERFTLGQLKLTAVLGGQMGKPTAIVETANGKGFTVVKGTKIGRDNGVVVEILPDRLLILETTVDFTGEKKTRTVELKLRLPGQEEGPKR